MFRALEKRDRRRGLASRAHRGVEELLGHMLRPQGGKGATRWHRASPGDTGKSS